MSKYERVYKSLIEKAKQRNWYSKNYSIGKEVVFFPVETHHIVPKCMGGSNDESNLVVFSLREHYIAHLLLTKIYPNNDKIITAFQIMSSRCGKDSKSYKVVRENWYRICSETSKKYYENPENRKAMSEFMTEKVKDFEYIKKVSEGVKKAYAQTNLRDKISACSKQMWKNKEYIEKFEKNKWIYRTKEFREKTSERIKKENKNNPELKQKRINGIKRHMLNKSDSWKQLMSVKMKEYSSRPEVKKRRSEAYKTSNLNRSRKVIDLLTKKVYDSCVALANELGLKYVTVKRRLYKNPHKYNYMWLDEYVKGEQNEQLNLQKNVSGND